MRTSGDTRVVAVQALADLKAIAGLRLGDAKLLGIERADDDRLLILTAQTAMPWDFNATDQRSRRSGISTPCMRRSC